MQSPPRVFRCQSNSYVSGIGSVLDLLTHGGIIISHLLYWPATVSYQTIPQNWHCKMPSCHRRAISLWSVLHH